MTSGQVARIRECLGYVMVDPPEAPPVGVPMDRSGQLPAFGNVLSLIEMLARTGPARRSWSAEAREDVSTLQRACADFLATWGTPGERVGDPLPAAPMRALEAPIQDAEVVG